MFKGVLECSVLLYKQKWACLPLWLPSVIMVITASFLVLRFSLFMVLLFFYLILIYLFFSIPQTPSRLSSSPRLADPHALCLLPSLCGISWTHSCLFGDCFFVCSCLGVLITVTPWENFARQFLFTTLPGPLVVLLLLLIVFLAWPTKKETRGHFLFERLNFELTPRFWK